MKNFLIFICALVSLPFVNSTNAATTVVQYDFNKIRYYVEVALTGDKTELDNEIQAFKADLTSAVCNPHVPNGTILTILDEDGKEQTFEYLISYDVIVHSTEQVISFDIVFENYYSFAYLNAINLKSNPRAKINLDRKVFFVERTATIVNPFALFFGDSPSAEIITEFNSRFNKSVPPKNEYSYVFKSSNRRTEVRYNGEAVEAVNLIDSYEYQIKITDASANDIVIFDRFANTPIWYGIAVGAAFIVMVVVYNLLKRKETNQQLLSPN